MDDDRSLNERFTEVRQRVADAAKRSGRSPESVILVAVTKYAEVDDIRELIRLGHQDFGENRVQQLGQRAGMISEWFGRAGLFPNARAAHEQARATGEASKDAAVLPEPDTRIRWHMIGRLQRNKAKKVAEVCRLIHSCESLRLAEELQQIADRLDEPIEVLVQVNCSGEESKQGCAPPAALPLVEQIDSMMNVRVRGLMTMAPYNDDPEQSRPVFERCRELYAEIAKHNFSDGKFNILSMGMSGDYEVAIQEGANVVRVGSAIFGERPLGDEPEPIPEPASLEDATVSDEA